MSCQGRSTTDWKLPMDCNGANILSTFGAYVDVIVLKRSWPAVSHICSFTLSPSTIIVRILKSTPIVVIYVPTCAVTQQQAHEHYSIIKNIWLLPRCMECSRGIAMGILSVRPSVCQTRALWQNRRKLRLDFYIIWKNIYPSFLRRRMVGGGRPLLPEILGQPAHVGAKSPILNR